MATVLLVACGGNGDDGQLPPSSPTATAHRQKTLTRAEYPAMREWIISDPDNAAELRPICDGLDAGPDTPVIRAARKACDRVLSLYMDIDAVGEGIAACMDGDLECLADAAEPLRDVLVNLKRVALTYIDDLGAVMASGPCLKALQGEDEDLRDVDRAISSFDEALRQVRLNNPSLSSSWQRACPTRRIWMTPRRVGRFD